MPYVFECPWCRTVWLSTDNGVVWECVTCGDVVTGDEYEYHIRHGIPLLPTPFRRDTTT